MGNELTAPRSVTLDIGLNGHVAKSQVATMSAKSVDQLTDEDIRALQSPRINTDDVLAPSNAELNLAIITRLSTFKVLQNQDAHQLADLLATLAEDLTAWPQWAVEYAAERYRLADDHHWFPMNARTLMSFADRKVNAWRDAVTIRDGILQRVAAAGGFERIKERQQRRQVHQEVQEGASRNIKAEVVEEMREWTRKRERCRYLRRRKVLGILEEGEGNELRELEAWWSADEQKRKESYR